MRCINQKLNYILGQIVFVITSLKLLVTSLKLPDTQCLNMSKMRLVLKGKIS